MEAFLRSYIKVETFLRSHLKVETFMRSYVRVETFLRSHIIKGEFFMRRPQPEETTSGSPSIDVRPGALDKECRKP